MPNRVNRQSPGVSRGRIAEAIRHPAVRHLVQRDRQHQWWQDEDDVPDRLHDAAAIGAFIERLPCNAMLILDEAYIEFAPDDALVPFDTADARVLRMRTFSKAHGMAGARIGYVVGCAQAMIGYAKIRNHFGINRIALAGALASMRDVDFIESVQRAVAEGREDYYRLARKIGLDALRSATNFVAIDVGGGDRARRLLVALEARDVFIRMPGVEPLDRCIRASIGTPTERRRFAEVLEETLPQVN